MMDTENIFRIILILFFSKTLIVGGDFSFYLFIKYKGVYWNWYCNREQFKGYSGSQVNPTDNKGGEIE